MVLKSQGTRPKIYNDISVVSFSQPATCAFRESLEKSKSRSSSSEVYVREIIKKPKRSGSAGQIVNLNQDFNQHHVPTDSVQNNNSPITNTPSNVLIFTALSIGLLLVSISSTMVQENSPESFPNNENHKNNEVPLPSWLQPSSSSTTNKKS